MSARRSGGGVNALLVAYILVFALIAGVVGLVLINHDRSSGGIDIKRPTPTAKSTGATPPKTATPPSSAPTVPPVATVTIPPPMPAPAPAPPAVATPSAPPGPAVPAAVPTPPPQTAMAPMGANGYPPPPPEKPPLPTKPAASNPVTAAQASPPTPASPPAPASAPASAPSTPPPTTPSPSVLPAATPQVAATPSTPPAPNPPASTAPTNPALLENGPYGAMPRISADGRLPWITNDARFDHRTRLPRISIVVIGLGFDAKTTEDAIVKLPPEISLAFLPYANNLDRWIKLARDFGHEVLISLPMEGDDPNAQQALGPRVLSLHAAANENIDRLRWVLARANGYIGLVTWEGETFLADEKASLPVLQEIAGRGLMVVDSRMAKANTVQQLSSQIGLPFAKSRGFLDEPRDAASIDANLVTLEDLARRNNFAMAMAVAFPISIDRLVNWSRTVTQRGFVLAPVTGVTQCSDLCQTRVQRHAAAVAAAQKQ